LIASVYQFWIDLQAAGPDHVGFTHDPIKRATVPTIPRDVQTAIHRWYYDKFFLHSKFGLAEETKILEIFDYAAKRYGTERKADEVIVIKKTVGEVSHESTIH